MIRKLSRSEACDGEITLRGDDEVYQPWVQQLGGLQTMRHLYFELFF